MTRRLPPTVSPVPDGRGSIALVRLRFISVLMGWGAEESRDGLWADVYSQLTVSNSFARMENSDHWYVGFESDVAELVRQFVRGLDD